MKATFVTWQLRRLHSELDALDKQRGAHFQPGESPGVFGRSTKRDRTIRRILLDRMLRSLPRRLGFRDARSFARAFARANHLTDDPQHTRRRLTTAQVVELEHRILSQESAASISRAIGCAEQTVMNRATQLRKRLAAQHEGFASGI